MDHVKCLGELFVSIPDYRKIVLRFLFKIDVDLLNECG